MSFQTLTIRTRLLLLTLVLIVPFIFLGFLNLWNVGGTSREYLDNSLKQQAELASKAFEQHLISQRQPLIMLSTLMAKDEDKFTIQDYLDSVVKTRAEWLDLQILDNKGKSLFRQKFKETLTDKDSAKDIKEEAERENRFTVESDISGTNGKKNLSIAMPLTKENTAVAQIDGLSIKEIFENLELPDENLIIVFDRNNRLLYRNRELPEDFSNTETAGFLFSKFKEKNGGTVEVKSPDDNVNIIYGISKIEMADAIVAVGKPTTTLYEPARQKFIRHAAISLFLTILAIAMAVFITRGITQPMKRLTDVVRRFGSGDRSVRTKELPDGTFGELSSTFNKMAGEIVERQNELEELDRLKSNFVDSVSHELRTPLTTIKTLTHVLKSDNISNAERIEYLGTIAVECNRQIEFVQTLLNLSRIESGAYKINLTPTDITGCIQKCVRTHKRTAEIRNLSLNFNELKENLPKAKTDREALCLVISSLIENALKYTPAGGEINLSAEKQTDRIAIAISDNGRGIRASDIPHIFEKFYRGSPLDNLNLNTTKENLNPDDHKPTNETFGIGLGLYLVDNLINELNVEIFVESPIKESNTGTKFTLILPTVIDAETRTK